MSDFEFVVVDDTTKVVPGTDPTPRADLPLFGLAGEKVAFQIAYRWARQPRSPRWPFVTVEVSAPGSEVNVYRVDLVPVACPSWRRSETEYMVDFPALLPDPLIALGEGKDSVKVSSKQNHAGWNSLWVEVTLPTESVHVRVSDEQDNELLVKDFAVQTLEAAVPAAPVVHTRWFHSDCLAEHYGVPMWSEEHWKAIAAQMHSAARMGITCLMCPIWTPPLDVMPGNYRHRAQLLGIRRGENGYQFDTAKLDRWLDLAEQAGIKQLEVPQFFTQWGASSAAGFYLEDQQGQELTHPDAKESDQPVPYFGWHTSAADPEYRDFLGQLIPFLRAHLEERLGVDNILWHVSDEPHAEHLQDFLQATSAVRPYLEDARVIDALADPTYLEHVPTPVVATSEIELFRAVGIEPKWVYYCVSQSTGQVNQFISQYGGSHGIQGMQLYKFECEGFLHWGLNFYYRQYSQGIIDPIVSTDSGGNFISGDPFIIYPGADGEVIESLRHRMIGQAWRDLALCHWLEAKVGRDKIMEIIDPDGQMDYAAERVSDDEVVRRRYALHQLAAQVA